MLSQMIQQLFKQSRTIKKLISLLLDGLFLVFSFWMAFALRLDSFSYLGSSPHWVMLLASVPVALVAFKHFGLYRSVLRYLSFQAAIIIVLGISASLFSMKLASLILKAHLPSSVPVIYAILAILSCGGSRLIARALYSQSTKSSKLPVIVYGAGEAGRQLASSLQQGPTYRVVALIDDDPAFHETVLQGIKVYPASAIDCLKSKHQIKKILLAIPSLTRTKRRDLLERLQVHSLELLSMPGLSDLVSGRATINELKEVSIDDLLGRDLVKPFPSLMHANIKDKVVMVTGAGGSIGSELCRQIIKQSPKSLLLCELSEFALYNIEQELVDHCKKETLASRIIPLLISAQDKARMCSIMKTFSVQSVYHAAAYKHVPLVEYNVVEGLKNNVFGTLNAALSAIDAKVETFVLISTDKAVRPTNVMGASKRFAELILQALAEQKTNTCFSMVRFGNVLGSSGSVVPLFKKQILQGGPITLTDSRITRYFMSIREAAQLVIQAGAMGRGGDVFVLDMGEPVKIIELAKKMIRLMGLSLKDAKNPQGDIEIKTIGLRPGEKLKEELLVGENEQKTEHPRILTALEDRLPWVEIKELLGEMNQCCLNNEVHKLKELLLSAPLAFRPTHDKLSDLLSYEGNKLDGSSKEQGSRDKIQV